MSDVPSATLPAPSPAVRGTLPLGLVFGAAFTAFFLGFWLDSVEVRLVSKPIPVLCLIAWLLLNRTTRAGTPVIIGLGFSVVGDVILETPGAPFVGGLLAFLVAHVAYIVGAVVESRRLALLWALPIAGWCVGVYAWLFPGMEDLAFPVAVYVAVIGAMGWRMGARVDGTLLPWLGFVGAVLFMLSDSVIAIRKFGADFTGGRELIMLTYWGGQALIATSVVAGLRRAPGSGDQVPG